MSRILMITSEAVPFAKTGGLADVCGSLPKALQELGQEVTLILPAYQAVFQCGLPIEDTHEVFDVPVGNRLVSGRILKSQLRDSNVPVYLLANEDYFNRPGLYGDGKGDYRDNCERFVFFCRGVMEAIRILNLELDLLHCHDWQTGLVPVYLRVEYSPARGYDHLRSMMTIHNLAYQGRFWHWDMVLTGLDWKYFNWRQLEFHGDLNLLKAGLVFADVLTTVSPTYAREIQSAPMGCGLEGVLRVRAKSLHGVLNGADYNVWNPEIDPYLPRTYNSTSWEEGKAANKAALQQRLDLPVDRQIPLLGFVGRLVEQKGIELITQVMRAWAPARDVQWAILGTGSPEFEKELAEVAAEFPKRVSFTRGFSEELAHQITASVDFFLMPSQFEPCGLSQLFSLKYGTVPVVHRTGGLADTIRDLAEEDAAAGSPNGFVFDEFEAQAFEEALDRALNVFRNQPQVWKRLVQTGMAQDWSWRRSALRYIELYQQTLSWGSQPVGA